MLRIMLGWIMLWAFVDKMFGLGFQTPSGSGWIDGGSPSSAVVYVTSGLFKGFFDSLAGNAVVDVLMMVGLLCIGVALILGVASKVTTVTMAVFLLLMFLLAVPPKDNPLIDYHLVYLVLMLAVYVGGGFDRLSLNARWKELWIVKRFRILT